MSGKSEYALRIFTLHVRVYAFGKERNALNTHFSSYFGIPVVNKPSS